MKRSKNKIEAQRFDIGDSNQIEDDRTRSRTPSWPHRDAISLCPVDKVPDNEKIIAHPFGQDHVQLIVQALADHFQGICARDIFLALLPGAPACSALQSPLRITAVKTFPLLQGALLL